MNTPLDNPFDDLRARVWAHRFDSDENNIVARLVKDQGWSTADAYEAIEQYRRFCFLSVVWPYSVTPSHPIDLVWHTHLLYTRDYYDVFCPQVLGRMLHHGPGGNSDSAQHFHEQYTSTLDVYQQHFGAPPHKWWPPVQPPSTPPRRFWVDSDRAWVVRKPRWWPFAR